MSIQKIGKIVYQKLEKLFIRRNLKQNKRMWDGFVSGGGITKKDARYYMETKEGENVTETQFCQSGFRDYTRLVVNDPLLVVTENSFFYEIGCGIGRMTQFIAPTVKHMYASDISGEFIKMAHYRLNQFKNVHLYTTNGAVHYVASQNCDIIFSYLTFQHMPSNKVVLENLKEVARILKKEGLAKIQVRGTPISRKEWSYGVWFDLATITELCTQAHLQIIKHEGEGQKYFWLWLRKQV